jgi:hypothetical protein
MPHGPLCRLAFSIGDRTASAFCAALRDRHGGQHSGRQYGCDEFAAILYPSLLNQPDQRCPHYLRFRGGSRPLVNDPMFGS